MYDIYLISIVPLTLAITFTILFLIVFTYSIWKRLIRKFTTQENSNVATSSGTSNSFQINYDIYQMPSTESTLKETGLPTYEEVVRFKQNI